MVDRAGNAASATMDGVKAAFVAALRAAQHRARELGAVEVVATIRREIAGLADAMGFEKVGAGPMAHEAEHINVVKKLR